jgi:choline dehydrogenase-like flavoprotein
VKFADLQELEDGGEVETDVCIVGAGAAGITLARELRGTGREVLLIESGGLDFEQEIQDLYAVDNIGLKYPQLAMSRLRFFGGTTNHWEGDCRPLDPIDFEKRAWVPNSGWPIGYDDLEPYYRGAHRLCELGVYDYDPVRWIGDGLIPFDAAKLESRLWQVSPPTRFGQAYRDDLEQAPNIRVLVHANAVELIANETASAVRAIRVRTLAGRRGTIRPRTVVLACGGIENARLLLASNGTGTSGLGNGNGLVGRFFMEHPHAIIGFAVPMVKMKRFQPYSLWPFEAQHGTGTRPTQNVRLKVGASERLQREQGLLNACIDVGTGYDRSPGYMSLRQIAKDIMAARMPDDFGEAVLRVIGDLDGLAGALYRRVTKEDVLWFAANAEQIPDPESRVTLANDLDALGMRRVRLDWRVSELEKRSIRVLARIVGEELARLGLARTRLDPWLMEESPSWAGLDVRYHHIGTTRMSNDARHGVVDANCRVHGLGNLYVAGSSVFCTTGYANPTQTIVALALRLADHLRTQ